VQNLTLKEAITQLGKAGITLYSVTGPSDPNAIVVMTDPTAGTQMDPSRSVTLVTTGKGGAPGN
jgi:serine/threonine-protein kinase